MSTYGLDPFLLWWFVLTLPLVALGFAALVRFVVIVVRIGRAANADQRTTHREP